MKNLETTDEFISFIQVLREEKDLERLFISLETLPENLRITVLGQIKARMKEAGEKAKLIDLIDQLDDKNIFDAILKAIKEK